MLSALRNFSRSWGALLLFGLLILSFGLFWNISDIFSDRGSSHLVATVGQKKIHKVAFQNEFRQTLERYAENLSQQTGKPADLSLLRKQAINSDMHKHVLSQMLQKELLLQEIQRLGLVVSDDQVRDAIYKLPYFQDEDGKFNRERFQGFLSSTKSTEAQFVDHLRNELSVTNFLSSFLGGISLPNSTLSPLLAYAYETREVRWTVLNEDLYPVEVDSPSEDVLKKYHQENATVFSAPEYRKVAALNIPLTSFMKGDALTKEELSQAYEAQKNQMGTPERRRLFQVRGKTESLVRAQIILNQRASIADLKRLVGDSTLVVEEMGWVERKDLPAPMANALFSLKKKEPSQIVKSPAGPTFFIAEEVSEAKIPSFAEAKKAVENALSRKKAKEKLFEVLKKIEDDLAGGSTFAEVAQTHGVENVLIDQVDLAGLDAQEKPASTHQHLDQILKIAFQTAEGVESQPQETVSGDFLIVRPEKVIHSQPLSFEAAKPQVKELFSARQKYDALMKVASGFADGTGTFSVDEQRKLKLLSLAQSHVVTRQGQLFDKNKKLLGEPLKGSIESTWHQILNRSGTGGVLPSTVVEDLFSLSQGKALVFTLPYVDINTNKPKMAFVVGRLLDVLPYKNQGQVEDVDSERDFKNYQDQALRSDALALFFKSLELRYPVKIYEKNTLPQEE